jgi:hypothetical protein
MNLKVEPLHKEEADRLLLVLAISFSSLLKQNIFGKEAVAAYVANRFPSEELQKLDNTIQKLFKLLAEDTLCANGDFEVLAENIYSNSIQKLKALPFGYSTLDLFGN